MMSSFCIMNAWRFTKHEQQRLSAYKCTQAHKHGQTHLEPFSRENRNVFFWDLCFDDRWFCPSVEKDKVYD